MQDAAGVPLENLLAGGIDEWFSRTRGGQTQHFVTDALGSTLRLTDASGAKVVDYRYDPYGGTVADTASSNVFQYAGRENDGLGLYFNRARYLKPRWGRFISQDPIGLAGGHNIYAYVEGNPLSYVDPRGLNPGAAAGAGIGSFFGPVGTVVGAVIGAGAGAYLGWNIVGPMIQNATSDHGDDDVVDEDDCGCYKILEERHRPPRRRNFWTQGDNITWRYHKCMEECKKNKPCGED